MNYEIKIERIYKFDEGRKLKAFADIVVNDVFVIKGLKVIEGGNGLFVTMPQNQAKDEKWYDIVRVLDQEVRDIITGLVIEAYQQL